MEKSNQMKPLQRKGDWNSGHGVALDYRYQEHSSEQQGGGGSMIVRGDCGVAVEGAEIESLRNHTTLLRTSL